MGRLMKDESANTENTVNTAKTAEEYKKAAEAHKESVKNMRKTFLETGIIMIMAVVAIIVISVAWFLNNSRVGINGINIEADSVEKYVLASAGIRQNSELEKYKENGMNILSDTAGEEYDSYYDTGIGENVTLEDGKKLVLYKGTAWHLQDNGTMQPGSRGVLEFYVIPQVEGLKELKFTLDTVGFRDTEDENNPVLPVDNTVLHELLKGHILFFTNLDDVNGYSGWLGADEKRVIVKAKSGDLQKDLPYKVSIYWIWPRRYRNFIYHQNSTHGDLFAADSEDYRKLISFINENESKFFYNYNNSIDGFITGIDMDDSVYALGTSYYNIADEYIGKNVNYVYLEIKP